MNIYQKQRGFSLFLVLILMLVIALLVIVTSQSANTELRISSNEADRKYAMSLAENGLNAAEEKLNELANGIAAASASAASASATSTGSSNKNKSVVFTANCENGLCLPAEGTFETKDSEKPFEFGSGKATIAAWERCANNPSNSSTNDCQGKTVIDKAVCEKAKTCIADEGSNAHYIIEYLGSRKDKDDYTVYSYFRVTSRAYGKNTDTVVTLQSYVELHSE
jgi:putative membrane protein